MSRGGGTSGSKRLRVFYIIPCFAIFSALFVVIDKTIINSEEQGRFIQIKGQRSLKTVDGVSSEECIPPSINSFPGDFFTQEERRQGGVVIHFLLVIYLCAMLANVCDEYFVPSLEIISKRLKLSTDVAGATFMAIGTSSPELFSSIIGSFITESDIGIGTIVGSAVFNILGVTGMAGVVLWKEEIDIDWYPITRDCFAYGLSVTALILVISNNVVSWWESLILLVMYGIYIVIMYYNAALERFSKRKMKHLNEFWKRRKTGSSDPKERSPLLGGMVYAPEVKDRRSLSHAPSRDSFSVDVTGTKEQISAIKGSEIPLIKEKEDRNDVEVEGGSICSSPKDGGPFNFVWWVLMWPASLLFFITMPDIRKQKRQNWFPLTFLVSVLWIGLLSYFTVWMVTIIGHTLGIPDTVSGITILAAGTSVPEIISSLIVVKEGLGNMAICNLIGSNTFDILFCLGAPWFIKTLSSTQGYLIINSSALTYTTTTLLMTVVAVFVVLHLSSWKLNRTVGIVCLTVYAIFLVVACMYELNIFGDFNPPTCSI